MALFKLTTKKLLVSNGKRLEAGMTAEVSYNSSIFPWGNSTVRTELKRQLKMKYNVDFPDGFINANNFSIENL